VLGILLHGIKGWSAGLGATYPVEILAVDGQFTVDWLDETIRIELEGLSSLWMM
jgi:hypothetical protein